MGDILFVFPKQPDETEAFAVDFSDRMGTGETIDSKVVTAVNADTGADASAVISGSAISGQTVVITVTGGDDQQDYKIKVKATTSTNNVLEADVTLRVVEK